MRQLQIGIFISATLVAIKVHASPRVSSFFFFGAVHAVVDAVYVVSMDTNHA